MNTPNQEQTAIEGQYEGHPTLELRRPGTKPDKRGFTFGLAKAKLILDNIEAIQLFVAKHGKEEA